MSSDFPNRRSVRLRGYDYAEAGAYFITICTTNRAPLFGHITDDRWYSARLACLWPRSGSVPPRYGRTSILTRL